jgi:hypothetical protein
MSNIMHCHLWLLPRLHFTAVGILTNSLILFSIIVYCLPEDVKKKSVCLRPHDRTEEFYDARY